MFKAVSKNLIPENFRENKFINDVLDVFVDYIYENSNIAIDIKNLFNSKNEVIFEELIKIYAQNFYKTIMDNKKNFKLLDQLHYIHDKWGFNFDETKLDLNILKLMTQEQLETFKLFLHSKGTLKSIEYIYKIIEKLGIESYVLETDEQLKIYEGKNLFEYVVEGSMLPEIFEAFVKPLCHPVGWCYLYVRTYNLYFDDYFLSKEVFEVNEFKISFNDYDDDFKNNRGYLFETDENNNILYDKTNNPRKYEVNGNYQFNVTRFGKNYSTLVIPTELKLVISNKIEAIEKTSVRDNERIRIYFESGEVLEKNSKNRSLILYYSKNSIPNYDDFLVINKNNIFNTIIKPYPLDKSENLDLELERNSYFSEKLEKNKISVINKIDLPRIKKDYSKFLNECVLKLDYDRKIVTALKDRTSFQIDFGLASTAGKIAALGAGNFYLGIKNYKLGDLQVNPDIPITYRTRISDRILKTTNYKALYKLNKEIIRPIFNKVTNDWEYHIKYEKLYLSNKDENDVYFLNIGLEENYFVECLDLNYSKVNVEVILNENNTFTLKSQIRELILVYWEDKLNKIITQEINAQLLVESDNLKFGKYYFEVECDQILNVFQNNKKVKPIILKNERNNSFKVYVNALVDYVVQDINEKKYQSSPELLQLNKININLNKNNNWQCELDFKDKIFLNYFSRESKRISIRYVEMSGDLGLDKIVITANAKKLEKVNINADIYYLKNLKERKTIVSIDSQNIEKTELPLRIQMNGEFRKILNEKELRTEFKSLKLYFNEDTRNSEIELLALNENNNLLEKINLILRPTIKFKSQKEDNIYEVIFDKQLQKSYDMWSQDVWKYEVEPQNNHYVNYFSTNDVTYEKQFLRISDKLEYKLAETSPNGLFIIDEFNFEQNISSGFNIKYNFEDKINLEDNLIIEDVSYYQQKYGWRNGYVDVYDKVEYLDGLYEKCFEYGESVVIQTPSDFMVMNKNKIEDVVMPKICWCDKSYLVENDFIIMNYNSIDDIKNKHHGFKFEPFFTDKMPNLSEKINEFVDSSELKYSDLKMSAEMVWIRTAFLMHSRSYEFERAGQTSVEMIPNNIKIINASKYVGLKNLKH